MRNTKKINRDENNTVVKLNEAKDSSGLHLHAANLKPLLPISARVLGHECFD